MEAEAKVSRLAARAVHAMEERIAGMAKEGGVATVYESLFDVMADTWEVTRGRRWRGVGGGVRRPDGSPGRDGMHVCAFLNGTLSDLRPGL